MSPTAPATAPTSTWEETIRTLEEQGRTAFLAGDTETLQTLWADDLLVNSPLNTINGKSCVLDLLGAGRIRHTRDEVEIERINRFGEVVVVMGRDRVDGPPHGETVDRRFTNVWQLQDGTWMMIARHCQVIAGKPAA
jgi:ketosteroid isomerase-like protein